MGKPFKPGDKVVYKEARNGYLRRTVSACDNWEVLYNKTIFVRPDSHTGKVAVQLENEIGFEWAESLRLVTPLEELL